MCSGNSQTLCSPKDLPAFFPAVYPLRFETSSPEHFVPRAHGGLLALVDLPIVVFSWPFLN